MTLFLANKRIVLGVTGSIAAYKSADIVRRLREQGAKVRVVMTENAKRFITPLTMQAVSGHPVHDDLFDVHAEAVMGHIELARWADVVLIAPVTADVMARLAYGEADDLLTTVCLATKAPVALAPAMNQAMWGQAVTQENRQALSQKGVRFLGPTEGSQACGDVGWGRLMEPDEIVKQVSGIFATGALSGRKVLITAGPTHEAIDPVRFITNASSGKMGYALAEAAYEAGATVTLVSGPVSLGVPSGVLCERVVSATDMYDAVMRNVAGCDIFLAVAAVGDYRLSSVATEKIHKESAQLQLTLERNPDLVEAVQQSSPRPFIVGFAAETERVIQQAQAKRERKKMDMIIANRVGRDGGMGSDDNEVTVLYKTRGVTLPLMPKRVLARELIDMIAEEVKKEKSK